MYKIALVNMPFNAMVHSSLGLTKLKSVLDCSFKGRISTDILYLNHDFARYIGVESYYVISKAARGDVMNNTAFGEWFFRQSAFPQAPDNTKDYFSHYYTDNDEESRLIKRIVRDKRPELDHFLDKLIVKYKLDKVNIVGFTSVSLQNLASFAMARKLKDRNPSIITVIGGPNCEFPIGETIAKNIEQIDFVFSGPALKSFPEFVRNCLDGEMNKCHRIDGVFSKKNRVLSCLKVETNEVQCSDDAPCVEAYGEDLDINIKMELNYDSFFDAFEEAFPNGEVTPVLLFETSRGCWWAAKSSPCTFCGLNGSVTRYQAMNPENAKEQFKSLFKYSARCQVYESVDNTLPKNYIREVFPYIEMPSNINIFYEIRSDLNEEYIRLLSKTRLRVVQPGIEALSTPTLRLMNKGTTAFQNLRFLKNCLRYSVFPLWGILVGSPGEGEEVYKKYLQDIPRLTHLPAPMLPLRVGFARYSPYFGCSKKYGLSLSPYHYYKLIYPFDEAIVEKLAFWFYDENTNAEYAIARDKWFGKLREKVKIWQQQWSGRTQISEGNGKECDVSPVLIFKQKGSSTVIHDSRSGQAVEYEIDDADVQVLEYLEIPRTISDISNALGHISGLNPEDKIANLWSRGLLFQEGDRFMSLVVRSIQLRKKPDVEVQLGELQSMTTSEFLSYLLTRDIHLWFDGGHLRYSANASTITTALRQELRSRKSDIVVLLQDKENRKRLI